MTKSHLLGAVCACILTSSWMGETQAAKINIDFGDATTSSGVTAFGADAGVAGYWNSIPLFTFGFTLNNTSGAATTASYSFDAGSASGSGTAPPTTNDELVLDWIGSISPNPGYGFHIDSLPADIYDIYIYTNPDLDSSGVALHTGNLTISNGTTSTNVSSVNDGSTILLQNFDATSGLLEIDSLCSGLDFCGISGMQLVGSVPIPPAIWLFGSGLLGLVGVARSKKAA